MNYPACEQQTRYQQKNMQPVFHDQGNQVLKVRLFQEIAELESFNNLPGQQRKAQIQLVYDHQFLHTHLVTAGIAYHKHTTSIGRCIDLQ